MAESGRTVRRAFVVSDLHLRKPDDTNYQRFLSFLQARVAPDPDATLVVAGDLFDFWYGVPGVLPPDFQPVLRALEALPDVVWIEGNHDLRVQRGLGGRSRIHVVGERIELCHGSRRVHLEHGDLIRASGRVTRRALRSRLAELGARVLGPRRTQRLGNGVAARRHGGRGYEGRSEAWLRVARDFAGERRRAGCSLTVLGHGHWLGSWDEGLVCLGDWLQYFTYLELEPEGDAVLKRFEPQELADPSFEPPSSRMPR